MLAGILFLTLIVVVAVLITVDIVRTPTEAPAGSADRHGYDTEHAISAARSGTGVRALSREPAVREQPAPPAVAGARFGTGPVEVDSFERTDQAARAFDQMHREMSRSAASEAELRDKFSTLFLNLSHRSQSLVERQLRLIEDLEHGEQDARRLTSLSKLNRIAMRMHRISQNLLVVAGQQSSPGWNQPVTLAHLVGAALAEVEDYQRVSFEVQPDIAVRGSAVNDLVHLLVELIENATSFSAAEMPVHIKGHILTSGGALVEITDRGIGMPAKEMTFANQQLDNPPAGDIDVPKWMGLLVVARLAVRHGIRVRLNQAELGGLTALVWLPDEILTHYSAAADPGLLVEQRAATASSAAFASARVSMPDVPAARPDPAWSARGPQATIQAEPAPALRLSGSGRPDAPSGDLGVVVPHTEGQPRTRGLPIFDEVESRWSRGDREAPGPAGWPAAAGPAPSGLPRRPSPAAAGPRAVPGTPPAAPGRPGAAGREELTASQQGASRGRAAPAEEANPGGPDEP